MFEGFKNRLVQASPTIKYKILKKIVFPVFGPFMARVGWVPANGSPLDDRFFRVKYGFDEEKAIKKAALQVRSHSMVSLQRLATVWQQVRYVDTYGLKGCLVECGVGKGGTVGMMALAHQFSSSTPQRQLHLFDSFEGLPEPKAGVDGMSAIGYSKKRASGALKTIKKCVGTLDENKNFLEKTLGYPKDLLQYHVGWFEQTLPKDSSTLGPIAILRIDGDWYESTKVCLENLYEKVIPGGIIIIDDYGHWEGCKRATDEFLGKLKERVLLSHIDYSARYWIKQS
jgi:O-methyltransferase